MWSQYLFDGVIEFFEGERFAEQGLHSPGWSTKILAHLRKCRGHDERLRWQQLPDAGNQLIAVHARHKKISDDHVELAHRQQLQGRFAALRLPDLVSGLLQQQSDGPADGMLIVHQQYLNSLFHGHVLHNSRQLNAP